VRHAAWERVTEADLIALRPPERFSVSQFREPFAGQSGSCCRDSAASVGGELRRETLGNRLLLR
jgi:hypothetical protein